MKNLTTILLFLIFSSALFAQTYLDVTPGFGTLNDAITANQGNVIYRLQAGQWYILNGQIENNGFPLTIVGTTPATEQMPAVIQTATNADGTVLSTMFSVLDDLTMRKVFIVNANEFNTVGAAGFPMINVVGTTSIKVVLDSVTCDPVGISGLIFFNKTPRPKLFMTNCLFLRMGHLDGANDGVFAEDGAPGDGYDTLYVENNTFMCTGTFLFNNNNLGNGYDNFIWVNHNSFIFHKNQFLWEWHVNSEFVTNNLFFDFQSQPLGANSPYDVVGDLENRWPLIFQDTCSADSVNGQLQSSRKYFIAYNSLYLDPRIQAYVTTWAAAHTKNNDGITSLLPAYYSELFYPADSASVNREAQMCSDKTHFPYFYQGNYWSNLTDATANTDPKFRDTKFYAIQDSLYRWSLPAMELNTWSFSSQNVNPQPNQIGNWFWCQDTVYNYGNPVVWPRVNASYTNSTMLTASIEGLPLGDLNWFPTKKAVWQQNQTDIMRHILNENTSVFYAPGSTSPTFSANTDFATGKGPIFVVHADINGDSKPDIITANQGGNSVSVLLNTTSADSSAAFSTATDFTVGNNAISVAVADVNGDSKPDIIVANGNDNNVSVLLNTTSTGASTPTFSAQTTFSVGTNPVSIVIADVNADGKPDVVVTNNKDNTVSVLLNTASTGASAPTFSAQTTFVTGGGPFYVAIADVNGDSKPDIITANLGDKTVSVLLNTTTAGSSTAAFSVHSDFTVGNGPYSVAAADVNGDGRPDIVTANLGSNTVSVLLNTTITDASTATFSTNTDLPTGGGPYSVALSDVDGNGKPDIIVTNLFENSVSVLLNSTSSGASTPTFIAHTDFGTGGNSPYSVTTADVNSDGKQDIVVVNIEKNTVSVLLNTMTITSVKKDNNQVPVNFALSQNYPNPFNPTTNIQYSVAKSGNVSLKIYNVLGQEVATLVNQEQKPGNYTVTFNASRISSGIYFYRIQAGNFTLTKKMILLK